MCIREVKKKTFTNMEELLKELRQMSALQGEESVVKAREIAARYTSPGERAFIERYMREEGDRMESEVHALSERLERLTARSS